MTIEDCFSFACHINGTQRDSIEEGREPQTQEVVIARYSCKLPVD